MIKIEFAQERGFISASVGVRPVLDELGDDPVEWMASFNMYVHIFVHNYIILLFQTGCAVF